MDSFQVTCKALKTQTSKRKLERRLEMKKITTTHDYSEVNNEPSPSDNLQIVHHE